MILPKPYPSATWLLALTKPRSESLAQENLLRQGYDCLLPLFMVHKRRRGTWHWVEEPLFPRYVFVGVPKDLSWAPIHSTLGVSGLVRFGGRIATVPQTLIAELRASAASIADQQPIFQEGQAVRILGEGYSGLEGVFQMQEGEQRAQVLITLLGRPTSVRVDLSELVPG